LVADQRPILDSDFHFGEQVLMTEEFSREQAAEIMIKVMIRDALFSKDHKTRMSPDEAMDLAHDVYHAISHESVLWAWEEILRAKLPK
jgi:hypothetical protein